MKKHILLYFLLFFCFPIYSQKDSSDAIAKEQAYLTEIIMFEKSIPYQKGNVKLSEKLELNIPSGYKFIPKKESGTILFKYWNNPERDNILGMLVQEKFQFLNSDDWAFVLSEEADGYVKDSDADKIDYDDMLKELQDSEKEENEQRVKEGFGEIHTIGWASKPFYDGKSKILHWAKELKFGNDSLENTLNYDVRVLGRQGLLSMNAVATIGALDSVKKHIPAIIKMANFTKGNTYADFDSKTDNIAAYTIGGLVAGKLLAKAGLFALLLKNIKLIILGALALFSAFKNRIFGLFRKKEEVKTIENVSPNDEVNE